MSGLQLFPPFWPDPGTWDYLSSSECTNIGQGYCCNNIFFYGEVKVSGLVGVDMAFTFNRVHWSNAVAADAADAAARYPFGRAAKVYGCNGVVMAGGFGDVAGRWNYVAAGISTAASGAMWIDCADDPERALKKALRPRPRPKQMSRTTLGTILKVVGHACHNVVPPRMKRASSPARSGESEDAPDAAEGPFPPEYSDVSMTAGGGCVLPDRVTVNGTSYVSRRAWELNYYDDQGRLLNLTRITEHVEAMRAAASGSVEAAASTAATVAAPAP
ncbi:MAG: hypothetical protein M1832_004201 [Thelocarpon impressellum]|nr:MAG: hypothetical protein M1832_004201 [Thelocarpon impressellum]